MKCSVVTEETGAYEQRGWAILAAFTTEALAQAHVEALEARPGFTAESGPGSDAVYDVQEVEVWETPAVTPVLTWNIWETVQKGRPLRRRDRGPAYRVVRVIRAGDEASLWHSTIDIAPNEPDWATISVCAATEALALAEARRLAVGFTGVDEE